MLTRRAGVWLVLLFSLSTVVANGCQFYPGAIYDPKIPTLLQVTGHDWAEDLTDHNQLESYLQTLEKASPGRIRVVKYGETWERRSLYYVVIGAERNLARLDEIKAGFHNLAYPQTLTSSAAETLIRTLPAVVWLAYSVHGNETSGMEAALLTAYHLLAARGDSLADRVAAETLVIIDPIQNPDGRARFLNHYRQTRGRWPDPNRFAAEHLEDWPGGRTNHYLFDMNRDWFALTQPETRARVKAFLEWFPQVLVDLHEMGAESSYYFAPPAPPINPQMSRSQTDWHVVFGKNNAAWFDKLRFDYFTREVFDSFYPGYGEGWPMFQGAIGMTYEQAGVRGLVIKREDDEVLRFRDAVQHHFIASLSTVETAAKNREALLRNFYEVRKAGLQESKKDSSKGFEPDGFVLDPSGDKVRAAKLARVLMMQGIEVRVTGRALSLDAQDYEGSEVRSRSFPAGAYYVPLAQPARPLVTTLLARETPMDDAFLKEQERRYQKRLRDQFYDVTAWSLPLLYNVPCYPVQKTPSDDLATLHELPSVQGQVLGGKSSLAYLVPWGTNAAVHALAKALSQGIRIYSADKPFTQKRRKFPAGSLIVKVKGNPADLHERLVQVARDTGADIFATETAWVDEGVNFGSAEVRFVKKPNVALAYNVPTDDSSAGALRFLIEQAYDYPVTIIPTRYLATANLKDLDVLILPDASGFGGGYQGTLGEAGAQKLKQWVSAGGTLIAIGEATRWLTEEKTGLLATSREYRDGSPVKSTVPSGEKSGAQAEAKPKEEKAAPTAAEKKRFDLEKAILPEKELPGRIPGALMRVQLDPEHWLAFGYDTETPVMVSSRNIFTPLKLDKGRNVGLFSKADKLMMSGFSWADAREQLAEKAYLMNQPLGSGHVVAFAEDPAYRAFCDGLNILLFNAIFLGPAH
ncbi:MAG: M14 family metallopeptidase [Acidobacteriota bacterium]